MVVGGMGRSVSVVIPTRDRPEALHKVLPLYLREKPTEVIIIDDGSVPSLHLAEEMNGVRVVRHSAPRGLPAARNTGVGESSDEFIFFGEDDLYPSPGCLSKLVEAVSGGTCSIACGVAVSITKMGEEESLIRVLPVAEGQESLLDIRHLVLRRPCSLRSLVRVPFWCSCMVVRRSLLKELEFDPAYGGNAFREETDFQLAAQSLGHSIAVVPDAYLFHFKPRLRAGWGGGCHRHGLVWYECWVWRNNIRLLTKHRRYLSRLWGHPVRPRCDTLQFMLWRTRGYPGRITGVNLGVRFNRFLRSSACRSHG